MNPADLLDFGRETIWLMIKLAAPPMVIGLVVGTIVSLIQTLTQIQEQTLAFIPKILSIFVAILVFLPFMGQSLQTFWIEIANRIAQLH
jgi:flagellar biosynthetic protein FliQ